MLLAFFTDSESATLNQVKSQQGGTVGNTLLLIAL